MRKIAIDYGKRRIGIAMTDERGVIPLPYRTIDAGKDIEESSKNILHALEEYIPKIEEIVIGNPLLLNGKKSKMTEEVEKLKTAIENKVDIPIVLFDERLTSAQAELSLRAIGLSRKKRAEKTDAVSALIILQAHMGSTC